MKVTLQKKLKKLNVVIASHIFATGPALELEQYLYPKVKSLLFIGHPFIYRKETNSFKRRYVGGNVVNEFKAPAWKLSGGLIYLKDAFLTFVWVLFQAGKIDLYIGSDNFLAYIGLVLKRIGKVKEVVLYTIDYSPKRFDNIFFNFLYRFFDKQCLRKSCAVWNVSPEIAQAREKYAGLLKKECAPQITVPLGIWYDRIPKLTLDEKEKSTIVFMGHLLEKQGLDVVIEALPKILRTIPDAKLKIIGTGTYEATLMKLVNKLKLQKKVLFLGYIEDHAKVEDIMARGTIAVATYRPDQGSFTYFADPGKIKNYLACCLPIILTNVPPIARRLEREKCGIICSYNRDDIARKAIGLLKDREKLELYSVNARGFAKDFDWNNIFAKALSRIWI